jgi:hypothetical protein
MKFVQGRSPAVCHLPLALRANPFVAQRTTRYAIVEGLQTLQRRLVYQQPFSALFFPF